MTGASKLYVEDLQEEFVNDYIIPTLKAGADYEGYLLGTSFARPIIAKKIPICKKMMKPILLPFMMIQLICSRKEQSEPFRNISMRCLAAR